MIEISDIRRQQHVSLAGARRGMHVPVVLINSTPILIDREVGDASHFEDLGNSVTDRTQSASWPVRVLPPKMVDDLGKHILRPENLKRRHVGDGI